MCSRLPQYPKWQASRRLRVIVPVSFKISRWHVGDGHNVLRCCGDADLVQRGASVVCRDIANRAPCAPHLLGMTSCSLTTRVERANSSRRPSRPRSSSDGRYSFARLAMPRTLSPEGRSATRSAMPSTSKTSSLGSVSWAPWLEVSCFILGGQDSVQCAHVQNSDGRVYARVWSPGLHPSSQRSSSHQEEAVNGMNRRGWAVQ